MHILRSIITWFSLLYWTILSSILPQVSEIAQVLVFFYVKSYHVKSTTVALTINISLWKLCQVDTLYIFAIRITLFCIIFTLTHRMSNLLSETCVIYCWEYMTCEFWIKIVSCCYGVHNNWSLGNMTSLLNVNLSFILHLTIL